MRSTSIPAHYSTLPKFVSRADVVLVQVAPADDQGRYSLGLADDYLTTAIDSARSVVAEVNDQVPFTNSAQYLTECRYRHRGAIVADDSGERHLACIG